MELVKSVAIWVLGAWALRTLKTLTRTWGTFVAWRNELLLIDSCSYAVVGIDTGIPDIADIPKRRG